MLKRVETCDKVFHSQYTSMPRKPRSVRRRRSRSATRKSRFSTRGVRRRYRECKSSDLPDEWEEIDCRKNFRLVRSDPRLTEYCAHHNYNTNLYLNNRTNVIEVERPSKQCGRGPGTVDRSPKPDLRQKKTAEIAERHSVTEQYVLPFWERDTRRPILEAWAQAVDKAVSESLKNLTIKYLNEVEKRRGSAFWNTMSESDKKRYTMKAIHHNDIYGGSKLESHEQSYRATVCPPCGTKAPSEEASYRGKACKRITPGSIVKCAGFTKDAT
jgi:hypothetical protein